MKRPGLARFSSVGQTFLSTLEMSANEADKNVCPTVARTSGYTLVEILVATTLSLLLLGAVVRMFGDVGQSITDSRAMLESADRLRVVQARLQQDLAGVTVTMIPPRKPENNEGYFEYIEGPVGAATITNGTNTLIFNPAVNTDLPSSVTFPNNLDTTAGDFDDILMFTTRSAGRPFVGRYNGNTIQSDVAEVAWFVRGRTLYRRVLLVAPSLNLGAVVPAGFYASYDVSARPNGAGYMVANTLGDLTRRECRYAHQCIASDVFPYDARRWRWQYSLPSGPPAYTFNALSAIDIPTLPTLRECSSVDWSVGTMTPPTPTSSPPASANGLVFGTVDLWSNATTNRMTDTTMTNALRVGNVVPGHPVDGLRVADDVILTNVIGFDVKAWDPSALVIQRTDTSNNSVSLLLPGDKEYDQAFKNCPGTVSGIAYALASRGAYVDIGNPWTGQGAYFAGNGQCVGWVWNGTQYIQTSLPGVYDTWSTHYEAEGTCPYDRGAGNRAGRAINGFDDALPTWELPAGYTGANPNGIVDDAMELLTSPPYPYPLRGIQVKIRVFEPDSRQVREVTVVQDFLPQ